jgi:hypothetical protein
LHQVLLEGLQGQLSVSETKNKRVVDVLAPYGSDIWSVEKILDKAAPDNYVSIPGAPDSLDFRDTYGAKGSV